MLRSRPRNHSSAASMALQREQRTDSSAGPSRACQYESASTNDAPASESGKISNERSSYLPSLLADVDDLASTMSALKFVPPSVRFGRGGRRGGLSRS